MERTEMPSDFSASSSEPSSLAHHLYVLPGSTAELEVTTAVTWASDSAESTGFSDAGEPARSATAQRVLPEGTELIVQIGELSASGAVSLDVVAMVLPSSSEMANINIPAGALAILSC